MGPGHVSSTVLLSEVNQNILDAAGEPEDGLDWEFFCECGRPDCHERVVLTLDAYVEFQESARAVLAPGHRLNQVERARRLRQDATALRVQAQLQVMRAKSNRPHPS